MDDYRQTFQARGHLYNDAMTRIPRARARERDELLDRVPLAPGLTVLDAPAGGGYVADGVWERTGDRVQIICAEPSERFSAAIRGPYQVRNESLEQLSLPDASVDVVLSLAGLHHVADRQPIYREWARLLRPGGWLSVADVAAGTPTGAFLNGFVDAHTPGGHAGIFIGDREFSGQLAAAGLELVADELRTVAWEFPDRHAMGEFCRVLFGIAAAEPDQVAAALADQVGVTETAAGVALAWQLRYAVARRPAAS